MISHRTRYKWCSLKTTFLNTLLHKPSLDKPSPPNVMTKPCESLDLSMHEMDLKTMLSNPKSYIPALQGMRGIAVSLVLMTHCIIPPPGDGIAWVIRNLTSIGWVGVDLFFALSGYLITRALLHTKGHAHYYRNFFARRFLRIVPLYAATLAVIFILSPTMADLTTGEIWPFLTYTSNTRALFYRLGWISTRSGYPLLAHTWSLAIEVHFYALFPLLVSRLEIRGLRKFLLFVLAASPLLRLLANEYVGSGESYFMTFSRLDALVMGALVAVWLFEQPQLKESTVSFVNRVTAIAITAVIVLWATGQINFHGKVFNLVGVSIVDGAATLSVLAVLIQPQKLPVKLISGKTLSALGRISYGVYLIHYPVVWLLQRYLLPLQEIDGWFETGLLSALSLGATLVLAMLSWKLIEKPALRLKAAF